MTIGEHIRKMDQNIATVANLSEQKQKLHTDFEGYKVKFSQEVVLLSQVEAYFNRETARLDKEVDEILADAEHSKSFVQSFAAVHGLMIEAHDEYGECYCLRPEE